MSVKRDRLTASNRKSTLSLTDRINNRLLDLEGMMAEQRHISHPEETEEHIQSISKFWSSLSETDRDYIHGCRYALEEKHPWNIDLQESSE